MYVVCVHTSVWVCDGGVCAWSMCVVCVLAYMHVCRMVCMRGGCGCSVSVCVCVCVVAI